MASSETPAKPAVCPVAHGKKEPEAPKVCPVAHDQKAPRREPADAPDHVVNHPFFKKSSHGVVPIERKESSDPLDVVPLNAIPASGRGNSEDGKAWLNPSANQLYRALGRKNKPIEKDDAQSVADVHVFVTEGTWNAITEYEDLYKDR